MALLTSLAQHRFRGSTRGVCRCFLMRLEGRWPKSDSCLLRAWRCKWPRRFCRPTARVSANISFTQPQLLVVLCLMRYEDWTFREAETRLREHQELRAALRLPAVPDYTTLYRFLRRLEDDTVDRGLSETVRWLRRRRRRAVSVADDCQEILPRELAL